MSALDSEPDPLVVPLSLDGTESLVFDVGEGGAGWASYRSPALDERDAVVFVRFAHEGTTRDPAIELRELHVSADSGTAVFNSPLLRTIPIGRMTAAVNRPSVVAQLRPLMPSSVLFSSGLPGSGLVLWTLPPRREDAALTLPDVKVNDDYGRGRKPDDFYRHVAELYLLVASVSNSPARDLAAENGVPVTTVHRWLKEARVRGHLKLPTGEARRRPSRAKDNASTATGGRVVL